MTNFNQLPSDNYKLSTENISCICMEYQQGVSGPSLGIKYRVAANTIYYWLGRKGIQTRGRGPSKSTLTNKAAQSALAAIASMNAKDLKAFKRMVASL